MIKICAARKEQPIKNLICSSFPPRINIDMTEGGKERGRGRKNTSLEQRKEGDEGRGLKGGEREGGISEW